MDQAELEAQLDLMGTLIRRKRSIKALDTEHAHDYAIRGLVLDGIFIVRQNGQPATYRAGRSCGTRWQKAFRRDRSRWSAHSRRSQI